MNGLGEFLEGYIKENDLSLRRFAEQVGVSHTYIGKLIKGVDPKTKKPVMPTIDTLDKIANAVNIPLGKLIEIAGYDIGHEVHTMDMVQFVDKLNPDQISRLKAVLDSGIQYVKVIQKASQGDISPEELDALVDALIKAAKRKRKS